MHALTAPLSELAEIEEICEERGREPGMLLLSGCVTSQKTHLMYALGKGYGHTLIVLSSEDKAKKLYEEYRFLNENTSYYPAKDLLFYQADIHGKQLVKQRMETLQMMMEAKSQVTVITTIDGFMDELPSEAEIKGDILTISNGEALEFESLKEKIIKLGYDREAQVDGPGQFAVRGGIIDIYPLTEELPIRIEFWGDEVDSIRTFDVDSQRSVENLEQIVIYPADDRLGSDRKVSFINYFDPKDTLVFLDEPARLLEKGRLAENENCELIKEKLRYTLVIRQPDFVGEDGVCAALERTKHRKPNPLLEEVCFGTVPGETCVQLLHVGAYDDEPVSFAKMDEFVHAHSLTRTEEGHREIYLSNATRTEKNRLKTILRYRVK